MSHPAIAFELIHTGREIFPPLPEFSSKARIRTTEEYAGLCERAEADPDRFWASVASQLHWF